MITTNLLRIYVCSSFSNVDFRLVYPLKRDIALGIKNILVSPVFDLLFHFMQL